MGNNAINLVDPSGLFAPILLPIVGAIAGGGFAAWHYIEAHPCVDFLHSPEFWRIVLIGAGAGAVGFTVGFAVGAILPSGGLGWAIIGGIVSGGISGAAERLTYSLLSEQPITPRTILYAAAIGTVTGGVFGGVGYGVSRIIQAFVNPPVAQAAGPMSPELYKIGLYGKLRHLIKGTKLRAHHILQNVWAEHNIPGYSMDEAPAILVMEPQHFKSYGVQARGRPPSGDWWNVPWDKALDTARQALADMGIEGWTRYRALEAAIRFYYGKLW